MNELVIPSNKISFEDLDAFLGVLERAGGPVLELRVNYVLRSEDAMALYHVEKLLTVAEDLSHEAETLRHVSVAVANPPTEKKRRGRKKKDTDQVVIVAPAEVETRPAFVLNKPKDRKPIRAWRLLDEDGQVVRLMTIEEKDAEMAAGNLPDGATLHHPRAGKFIVHGTGLEPVE